MIDIGFLRNILDKYRNNDRKWRPLSRIELHFDKDCFHMGWQLRRNEETII